jgi:hypothetical protein
MVRFLLFFDFCDGGTELPVYNSIVSLKKGPEMMAKVTLPCSISRGAFSGELHFEIVLSNGDHHIGLAARRYFWTRDGRSLTVDEPAPGEKIDGQVAARVLEFVSAEVALVSIPDGEVVTVAKDQIMNQRPAESPHNVSVGS